MLRTLSFLGRNLIEVYGAFDESEKEMLGLPEEEWDMSGLIAC